ncbi:hypothetical protein GCM10023194_58400 [Planotetraspora phitsanulokensis]|uniref:Uncharacterized protein n=1 Tax=Planotetraspora phitsanulokensis TaxID=575192 RepID=A0A8J3UAZ0_9ACTN|nr:hypothetical protein Pph01_53050 [Planotetraspora phitsanulokensis]
MALAVGSPASVTISCSASAAPIRSWWMSVPSTITIADGERLNFIVVPPVVRESSGEAGDASAAPASVWASQVGSDPP